MKKLFMSCVLMMGLILCVNGSAYALVWGVNPGNSDDELVNIDPFTGILNTSYALPSIGTTNTDIGLAGWSDALYYINGDVDPGWVYVFDPTDGSISSQFGISGGWNVDGLGFWSGTEGSYLYTSGCIVDDMHRYVAVDGSGPTYFWSDAYDPRAVAGDNGGRIFTYSATESNPDTYNIYEVDPLVNTGVTLFANSPSENIVGMAYDGTYLYMSDTAGYLYTMDNSGALISSLDLGYTLYALASTEGVPAPVPEPSTILLVGTGLLGIIGFGRKRFNKKA